MSKKKGEETLSYNVTSGYGSNTKEPYVEVEAPKLRVQMSPENARDFAMNLLSAAEAAYSDAFLVEFAMGALGSDLPSAGVLLREFRAWREQKQVW